MVMCLLRICTLHYIYINKCKNHGLISNLFYQSENQNKTSLFLALGNEYGSVKIFIYVLS